MNLISTLFGRRGNTYPLRDLNAKNIVAGSVAGLLALTGPPILILEAAANGNFTMEQTVLWVFATFVFGGLYSIFVPLYYRVPVVGAQTLTGIAFLITVTSEFSFSELVGAYIFSGLLMFAVGYFGAFAKVISYIPKEIISAMLAGMIAKFMINFVLSINDLPLIGLFSLISYFVFMKWMKRVPPIAGALIVGLILLFLTEPLTKGEQTLSFVIPYIQVPEVNVISFIAVSIPLALLILSNDAAVGIAALKQNNFNPPVNQIVSLSGIFSMLAGVFGGQSANSAGVMSAICSDDDAGPKEKRYMGAVVTGVQSIIIGVFAWKLLPFVQSLPQAFVAMVIGFGLLIVFGNSLQQGFSNPNYRVSSALAFIIAASGISISLISAPIWAMLIGTIVARFIESEKPEQQVKGEREAV
ncbi:benzoate transporter [bacterium LRH843]|nr:benzoate transporter [bacterium LRH843]